LIFFLFGCVDEKLKRKNYFLRKIMVIIIIIKKK
jgi:hypothetical protein